VKNLTDMMKQARELQSKLAEVQADLEALEIEGKAGGGLVRVIITGKGATRRVHIDPSLIKAEEAEILEDLIVAAANDAKAKMEHEVADRMKALTGGLPLPPGMNLGF